MPNAEQAAAIAALVSFRFFVEEAWPVVVPAEPFKPNWHIDAICDHLQAVARLQIRDLLINIPPRFGKSTIASVMFPAWLWLQDPRLRLLYSSYAQSLSTRDSVAMRQLIESPWYQARWGAVFQIASDQNEKTRFENNHKGYRLATSVGGANTGEGGDVIVADDPHNVQEVESEVTRKAAVRWWNEVMSTRGNNPATTRRIVIMQRVHEQDLAGDILEKGGYVHLNLPMEYEPKFATASPIGWADPRKVENQLLWPERYGPEWVAEQKKRMGSYAYAAQFQQRPAPLDGGMFKRSWWKFYRTDPALLLEGGTDDRCWSWDMAFKGQDDSDFVVGQAWARKGADLYLLHQIRGRLTYTATKAAVKAGATKFPRIHYKLVEDKANGSAVIDDLKSAVGGLVPVKPEGGKEARAAVVQPYAEAGNIYLPDPSIAPWVEDYIAEFQNFPKGGHDDQVDATSQAIVWLRSRINNKSGFYVSSFTKCWTPFFDEPLYRDPRYGSEPLR
jgi:predicted phage terminase large subunit-like protein